jgi:hypothetical protein
MSDLSRVRKPRCPLCDAPVEGDDELRGHLATVHELEDDPGTVTQVEALDPIIPADAVVAAEPVTLRVHDPHADDDRWRPIAIGFGGLVLLVLAVVALSIGKGLGL